jgi:hypothetical protein
VGIFRRSEPLHERLAREGGLTPDPPDPRPAWQETGIHGIARAREWDVTATADAPELEGDAARFVVLPDGTLLVEEGPEASLEALAGAVEESLQPPYRARAARQSGTLWAVQARRIRVAEIPDGPEGDTIELTRDSLLVDGERAFGTIPQLEELGDVVRAERLDGDLWEVHVAAL